ncbi:hypothetical protein ACFVS2_26150 [Brevibacillus sp. NPDC058079]|uniref:hypothetical protein n=1 Tax=Brevibacillus sp. NPDC058079 TaxID=3346330 RepID=UPI0036E23D0B
MILTKGKARSILFFVGISWQLFIAVNHKVNITQVLGFNEEVYEIAVIAIACILCLVVYLATCKWSKRFQSPFTDFGYTFLLGSLIGMIAGSVL